MRKLVLVILFCVYAAGCGKKQHSTEEMNIQEPMSMEALSTLNTEQKTTPEVKKQEAKSSVVPVSSSGEAKLEPLPPSGPYKPAFSQIQTALKNAGYYSGPVDGKAGPKTKKAIEEFQTANGLKVDGKVGPKTWALLSKNLTPVAQEPVSQKKGVLSLKNR